MYVAIQLLGLIILMFIFLTYSFPFVAISYSHSSYFPISSLHYVVRLSLRCDRCSISVSIFLQSAMCLRLTSGSVAISLGFNVYSGLSMFDIYQMRPVVD